MYDGIGNLKINRYLLRPVKDVEAKYRNCLTNKEAQKRNWKKSSKEIQ